MSWLWAIIVGFVLGLIARAVLPGKQHQPLWLTTLFGIAGGILGNAVAVWIGVGETRGIDWTRHLLQLAGAVLIVALGEMAYKSLRGGSKQMT
ncbi:MULTISPECIES: GlsB/YeaQ/YmgE family stress response membrane protein [unclassified Streptomyces]|uniref:GlsB/YeaQ/YmgE family stress response membrane protein n=1 Tax=unclassified Streptomyces TaxID=2593676 RepID=UPI00224EC4DE|nr:MULTISPECIES: GlsB/YeaQ/YmgE family stress response membrane protein [unclassified Streptomyces]MCX4630608.1 GlsB/YeaQ/YmgE family stress response membrane protein [Streptomyces sp. NBC_01443]WSW46527.1 GlsB/YeaQ/YmgE family stress response membrane protein [Streptomyces sp. NBC_01001]